MRRFLRILFLLVVPIIVALSTYNALNRAFMDPVNPEDKTVKLIEIQPDKTFREICHVLAENGVIRYSWVLELLARMKRIDTGISAGEYELSPNMTPLEILGKLVSGKVFKRAVMIREGVSIWAVGQIVEDAGLLKREDFNKAVADSRLLGLAGISAQSFEGYLFPETYHFSKPTTAKNIIFTMLEEGERRWPMEYTKRADELHLTRHEVMTLASVIEKESGNFEEQPIISSVFHNRLAQGMRLQSDPTVIYGIPNFNGNLTKDDLQAPTPYNTYVNFGLPPGPICNPGNSAIRAALFPAETKFLFFVGNGQGSHVFSVTLQEHNEAVRQYQLGK